MPYNINKFNGAKVTTVEDGTVDSTLDLKLVGKNYAGYGEIQNENFLHLLENFANTTPPPRKITGQLWYDSLSKKLKFYDGTQFRTTGGAEVGVTQPSGLSQGDFWFNTSTNQLFAWDGDEFVLVGPQAVENFGATELRSESVIDTNNITRPIVKAFVNNAVVFIISNAEFTLRSDSPLRPEFVEIKKGITLSNTNSSGVSQLNWQHWGTASSAKGLVDSDGNLLTAADFVSSSDINFNSLVKFGDEGFVLGDDEDIAFFIDNNIPILYNKTDDVGIIFKTKISSSTLPKTSMKLLGDNILPGTHEVSKIGLGTNNRFSEIYAANFYGTFRGEADKAKQVLADGSYVNATVDADPDTIVVRDGTGAITASAFIGTAGKANNLSGGGAQELVYQSSPNVTSFLDIGLEDQILSIDNGLLTWRTLGDLLPSIQANQLNVANETNPGNYYLTFVSGSSGPQNFKVHTTTLTYNPGSKTLTTDFFDGTAARAKYADLAEKYLADKEYEVGTVLMVGGDKEVTACTLGSRAIGVVSANPAYLMNSNLENGTAVALKGRVPVKVEGPVIKGARLVAGSNGVAMHEYANSSNVFAIALESSDISSVKIVEALIL